MTGLNARSTLVPLVLLWLVVHAVLLAVILSAKFLFTKTVLVMMLAMGILAFLFARFRARPQKLSYRP